MLCFAALGAGNGALFQLVPLRWPLATAVAGSMIGEIGALGGGLVPNAMGLSKQYAGTYLWGFFCLRGAGAGDAGDAARDADPLDAHLGRKGWRARTHAQPLRAALRFGRVWTQPSSGARPARNAAIKLARCHMPFQRHYFGKTAASTPAAD